MHSLESLPRLSGFFELWWLTVNTLNIVFTEGPSGRVSVHDRDLDGAKATNS